MRTGKNLRNFSGAPTRASRNNSAATVKMVKDLEAKLGPHTKNNAHREKFEEF